jgi:hypothetical protein
MFYSTWRCYFGLGVGLAILTQPDNPTTQHKITGFEFILNGLGSQMGQPVYDPFILCLVG